jgi:sulfoquinovosyltransferase
MKTQVLSLVMITVGIASAFTPFSYQHTQQQTSSLFPPPRAKIYRNGNTGLASTTSPSTSTTMIESNEAPELSLSPPRKICLMVEPTPFTHVSGYSNRFNEMLRYLSKANDHVDILTVDTKTPEEDLPKEKFGYKIEHTQGFTFPLYDHISLTFDLPEMRGANIIEKLKPDLIHASSP